MATESTQLFHQRPNVTQRLCLTVDSSPLAENALLRSNQPAVSPTFSIADILASSFPEAATEHPRNHTGQSFQNETFTGSPSCGETGICVELSPNSSHLLDKETTISKNSLSNSFERVRQNCGASICNPDENERSTVLSSSCNIVNSTDVMHSQRNFQSHEDTENTWTADHKKNASPKPDVLNDNSQTKLEVASLSGQMSPPENKTNRLASLTRSQIFHIDLVTDRQEASTGVEDDPFIQEMDPDTVFIGSEVNSSTKRGAISDSLDYLLDAARCARAETQLQEAETVVDALIAKFAEPLDLYTAWENLHRSSPIPRMYSQEEVNSGCSISSTKETKSPTFSPILSLLMTQPEAKIFPQLCQPSSTGRKLLELCKQLAGDIRRLKRKLRILHKARARRSSNSGCSRPNTTNHKSSICGANTVSSTERRSTYLRRLQEIWPEHDSVSEPCELANPVASATDRPGISPCVYTSPMECPLSLLSFVSESLNNIHSQSAVTNACTPTDQTTPNSSSTRANTSPLLSVTNPTSSDLLGPCTRELTVQVHSVDHEQRSPVAMPSCPSLSDTHPSFSGVESPQLATFSLFSPSLSPSSCSTVSVGTIGARISASARSNTKTKDSSHSRTIKSKDTISCGWSSSSSRSSSGPRKRARRRGAGADTPQITGKKISSSKRVTSVNQHNIPVSSPSKSTTSETGFTHDHSTVSRRRDHAPKLRRPGRISIAASHRPRTWEQLRVVVRDPDVNSLPDGVPAALELNSPTNSIPSTLTAPCSAPCVPFSPSESMEQSKFHDLNQTKRDSLQSSQTERQKQKQQPKQRHGGSDSADSLVSPSSPREWLIQDDHMNHGHPTRPPTPDIRRSDLDLADLSNGTRVLVIQGTHLRAGTLYLGSSSVTTSPSPIALPTSSLRDQLFRIQLDSEKPLVHPGSPRFTSLPSPSRVTPVPGRRTSSPAWTSNAGTGSFGCIAGTSGAVGTPKKRRQNDLILYGWQVVQQAVLEVFPASVRHVPPGTRVCAAWSEQLAVDLYPGTVAHAEPKEDIQPNSVPVGFDDGDRRQVPISSIRILPDHFTNLYELVSVTSDHGGTSQNDLLPSATDLKFGLTSRHSHLDQPINGTKLARSNVRARHHSAIERSSALVSAGPNDYIPTKRVARINSRVTTNSSMTGVVKKFEESDSLFERMQTDSISDRKEWSDPPPTKISTSGQLSSASHVPSQLSRSSSQKRHQSYVSSPSISTVDGCENYTQTVPNSEDVLVNEQSPSVKASTEFPEGPSTNDIPIHQEQHQHSPPMDHEVLSDTLSTTSSTSEQQQIWHILDKVRRRRSRGISCRSIIRQTDGLIISIGDSVEFSSGQDEAYLGEVRAIRWDEVVNAPIVTAAWYYNMNEAGAEGELLMQFKGAVFATEHHDENEARCILRRVHVAPSYAAYQATVQTTNSGAGSKENCSLIQQVVKPDPDACHRTVQNLSTETDPRRLDTNAKSPTDNIPSREQTKLSDGPQGDNQSTSASCSTSGDSDEAVYFVAGKYDPVHPRVDKNKPSIFLSNVQQIRQPGSIE